jgi:hypothetical protein
MCGKLIIWYGAVVPGATKFARKEKLQAEYRNSNMMDSDFSEGFSRSKKEVYSRGKKTDPNIYKSKGEATAPF